jgi:hypothetical protein
MVRHLPPNPQQNTFDSPPTPLWTIDFALLRVIGKTIRLLLRFFHPDFYGHPIILQRHWSLSAIPSRIFTSCRSIGEVTQPILSQYSCAEAMP